MADEASWIADSLHQAHMPIVLPLIRMEEEALRPSDHPASVLCQQNFDVLVQLQCQHQTDEAATCTRTAISMPCLSVKETVQQGIICEMNSIIYGQDTGLEHSACWKATASMGNSANAAQAAEVAA